MSGHPPATTLSMPFSAQADGGSVGRPTGKMGQTTDDGTGRRLSTVKSLVVMPRGRQVSAGPRGAFELARTRDGQTFRLA